jgi:hypothetical protein
VLGSKWRELESAEAPALLERGADAGGGGGAGEADFAAPSDWTLTSPGA